MENHQPEKWNQDAISSFIEIGRNHSFQTFDSFKVEYDNLVEIDSLFKKAIDHLTNTKDWFAALFLLKAHSSFRCATNICLTGQIPECYMVIRGCLESSLYGLYLSKNEGSIETYLNRNDNEGNKKKVKGEFKISNLMSLLASIDSKEVNMANIFYERTIDFGAHPNQLALMSALRMSETERKTFIKVAYITGDILSTQLCLKSIAQIGVCSLSIFKYVFKERFEIMGISGSIEKLKLKL